MSLLAFTDFLGRFHPLLVHLPIGILILAGIFQWMLLIPRFAILKPAIPTVIFWGALAGIGSCISGYLLAGTGDYDADLVFRHQWLGIATTASAIILLLFYHFHAGEWVTRILGLIMLTLLSLTGHLGGTLTHGEGYISEALNSTSSKGPVWEPMPDVQQVQIYEGLVKPLLAARCYSCHGSSKQKGKLRLDSPESISKGGEDGKVLIAGRVDESSLIERLLLPLDDDDHMPPKEKPQLTKTEIELLQWWVQTGASFNHKVADLPQNDKDKALFEVIALGKQLSPDPVAVDAIPAQPTKAADPALIEQLKDAGVMVVPVAENSNYLQAVFYTARQHPDSLLILLGGLRQQLISLKLGGLNLEDASLQHLTIFENLRRLDLNDNKITDLGLDQLAKIKSLISLNLKGNAVTAQGIKKLADLPMLKSVYLYQTQVSANEFAELKSRLPQVRIDTGGYIVPTFETDTTVLKY